MQKFALRVCTKQWDVPYLDLIEKCNLTELKTRRNYLSLGLLYKIVNEDCVFPNAPLVPYTTTYFTRSQSTNTFVVYTSVTHKLAPELFLPPYNFILELSPTSHNFKFLNCLIQISLIACIMSLTNSYYYYNYTTLSYHGYMLCTSVFCTIHCILCISA